MLSDNHGYSKGFKDEENNKEEQEFEEDEKEIELCGTLFVSEKQNDQFIDSSKKSTKPNKTGNATSERNESQKNSAPKNIFIAKKTKAKTEKNVDAKKSNHLAIKNSTKDFIKKIKDKGPPENIKDENESDTPQKEENSLALIESNQPVPYIGLHSQANNNDENTRFTPEKSYTEDDTRSKTTKNL